MTKKQDKRNAKGGGSVRQRPDGRWEARCTINGKSRSFYAETQKEALKLMRAAQKDVDDGQYIKPSKMTVAHWLDIWLEEYHKPSVKPSTYFSTQRRMKNYIVPALSEVRLQSLTPPQIQKVINSLFYSNRLSASFIKIIYVNFSSALSQAQKLGYIKNNPAHFCTLPKEPKKEIVPLSEAETAAFLKEIQKEDVAFKNLFLVTLFTGMRMGEICGLPWDAIDFSKNTITVKQQLTDKYAKKICGRGYYITTTKNGTVRTITAAPFVMEALKETKLQQWLDHIKMGECWKNSDNLVFTHKDGTPLLPCNVYSHYKNIVTLIGRPDARFHDLRHTYAVNALQEGDSPKTVQQNLGHATATFTLNVYAHVSEKMKQDSAARMQSFYEKIKA